MARRLSRAALVKSFAAGAGRVAIATPLPFAWSSSWPLPISTERERGAQEAPRMSCNTISLSSCSSEKNLRQEGSTEDGLSRYLA